ncbi:MAG: hypothetical protein ACKO0Z_21455 [Betaproteobacteria bacterium]
MTRDQVRPWRARLAAIKDKENLSDNAVGSRAKGLELDLRLREFEISQLTQRNNFFMIFQGVLIAGLVQSQGTAAPLITFSMSLLGVATSAFQIGMAGGAKYWQSRWEASTRSSEIALVLALQRQGKLAVQTFTHDSTLLTEEEREQIKKWNDQQSDGDEQITDDPAFIQKVVMADIQAGRRRGFRGYADWWVRRFAIAPKWSVSRIPIWIGAMLLVFWAVIASHLIRLPGIDLESFRPAWFELTPLKHDSPTK